MQLNLSWKWCSSRAVPHWILHRIRQLAELPHLLPLEEIAQPVWRMPSGVRAATVILSLAALVGGVRVLDAQIASRDVLPEDSLAPIVASTPSVTSDSEPTAMIVQNPPAGDTRRFVMVTVTGYTSLTGQTDGSPGLTATRHQTRPGTVALSRDLLRTFTPGAPFDFGDRVLIPGMGIYVVEDTMHPRWDRKADIWFGDLQTALRWGVRTVYITRLDDGGEPFLVDRDGIR